MMKRWKEYTVLDREISTVSCTFTEGTQEQSNQTKFPYYGSEEDQGPPLESEDSNKDSKFHPDAILSLRVLIRTVYTRSQRSQHSPPTTQAESSWAQMPTCEHIPYFWQFYSPLISGKGISHPPQHPTITGGQACAKKNEKNNHSKTTTRRGTH